MNKSSIRRRAERYGVNWPAKPKPSGEGWINMNKVSGVLLYSAYFAWIGWNKIGMDKFKSYPVTVIEVEFDSDGGGAMNNKPILPTLDLARKSISQQFSEFRDLPITDVEKQGHDNRTYRLGDHMLIRMPTAADYALKVPKEQELLPKLAKRLSVSIPAPIKMGKPSTDYPYPFSIYKWLPGKSINLLTLTAQDKERLAFDMATFLKELQAITDVEGPGPGQHNWWRGDHVSVYDKGAREQIAELVDIIDVARALALWDQACETKWDKTPVWIHGDFAIGNILMENHDEARRVKADCGKLSAVIDFGGAAVGDPACDLVIAWTYLSGKARQIFISKMDMDPDTWLRSRAWALWKATFELCQTADKNSPEAGLQKGIIDEVING